MYSCLIQSIKEWYVDEAVIPLHRPVIDKTDEISVSQLLKTTLVSNVGPEVGTFENLLKEYTGAKHVIATTSGTAALHVSLQVAGVKENEVVLTQSLTFAATGHAILQNNAKPIYIDIDEDTLSMSADFLKNWLDANAEITKKGTFCKQNRKRIAACLPVHIFGMPSHVNRIKAICDEWKIPLVEDAAEALGSRIDNQHCGLTGSLGILSFNGNKLITTGGGGAILTNDAELAARARHIVSTAKLPHAFEYHHDQLGYNYRMPALNASLGVSQLSKIERYLESKRELFRAYQKWTGEMDLELIAPYDLESWNHWLISIRTKDAAQLKTLLQQCHQSNVLVRPLWQPLHTLPHLRSDVPVDLTITEIQFPRILSLPSSAQL